ncbi:hypothetical protein TYRP_004213 [Tyrophagus putrescentiae]|nr:hypothetical protein TYRP_004213 [Tyrophagus putrescentiae]
MTTVTFRQIVPVLQLIGRPLNLRIEGVSIRFALFAVGGICISPVLLHLLVLCLLLLAVLFVTINDLRLLGRHHHLLLGLLHVNRRLLEVVVAAQLLLKDERLLQQPQPSLHELVAQPGRAPEGLGDDEKVLVGGDGVPLLVAVFDQTGHHPVVVTAVPDLVLALRLQLLLLKVPQPLLAVRFLLLDVHLFLLLLLVLDVHLDVLLTLHLLLLNLVLLVGVLHLDVFAFLLLLHHLGVLFLLFVVVFRLLSSLFIHLHCLIVLGGGGRRLLVVLLLFAVLLFRLDVTILRWLRRNLHHIVVLLLDNAPLLLAILRRFRCNLNYIIVVLLNRVGWSSSNRLLLHHLQTGGAVLQLVLKDLPANQRDDADARQHLAHIEALLGDAVLEGGRRGVTGLAEVRDEERGVGAQVLLRLRLQLAHAELRVDDAVLQIGQAKTHDQVEEELAVFGSEAEDLRAKEKDKMRF